MARLLDIDKYIDEQDRIMDETEGSKDPYEVFNNRSARALKIFFLQVYANQTHEPFVSKWVQKNGIEICDVCRTPRKIAELNNTCVGCNAIILKETDT